MNSTCPRCGAAVPFQLQIHPNAKCAICSIREVKIYYEDQIAAVNIKLEAALAKLAKYQFDEVYNEVAKR